MPKDTYFRMPWSELLAFLDEQGFTVLESGEFRSQGLTHHQVIAVHYQHKLLVYANSYNWPDQEIVNTCRLYGVYRKRPDVGYGAFNQVAIGTGNYQALGTRPAELFQLLDSYNTPLAARVAELLEVAEFVNWGFRLPVFTTPNLIDHGSHSVTDITDIDAAFLLFLHRCPPEVRHFISTAP